MSVETQLTKVVYSGNGVTTVFPVPFPYSRPEHINVMVTSESGLRENTSNFRLEQFENGDTNIIYPVTGDPLSSAERLTIYRQTPRTQILDLIYGGAFSPETLENDGFDRLCMMIQELGEESQRSIHVPIDSTEEASMDAIFQQLASYQEACAAIAEQIGQDVADVTGQMDVQKEEIKQALADNIEALEDMKEDITSQFDDKKTELENSLAQKKTELQNAVTNTLNTKVTEINESLAAKMQEVESAKEEIKGYVDDLQAGNDNIQEIIDSLATEFPMAKMRMVTDADYTYIDLGDSGFIYVPSTSPCFKALPGLPGNAIWIIIVGSGRPQIEQQDSSRAWSTIATLSSNTVYMLVHVSGKNFRLIPLSTTSSLIHA